MAKRLTDPGVLLRSKVEKVAENLPKLQLDREQHGVIELIDGTKSADEVHETILTKLKPLLKKTEPSKEPDSTQT